MNKSKALLSASSRIIPPNSLLKFGYSPNGEIGFDSASDLLSFSYSGATKADIGPIGLTVRDGNGFVVGHSAQLTEANLTSEAQIVGTANADSSLVISLASTNNVLAPSLSFVKNANAAPGTYSTIVADNEDLGQISWFASDGVDGDTQAAAIKVRVQDVSPEAGGVGAEMRFLVTTAGGVDSPSEALSIWNDLSANFAGNINMSSAKKIDWGNEEIVDGTNQIDINIAGASHSRFNTNYMRFYKNVFIGDSANTNMTQGMTINQAANDDEILAFKSSDVAHGMTAKAETDTFGFFGKAEGSAGGLLIDGFKDANSALYIRGSLGEAADTSDTAGSSAITNFDTRITDGGTSTTAVADAGNIIAMKNNGTTRWLLKGNGDVHQTTGAHTALDDWDDVDLLRAYSQVTAPDAIIRDEWDRFIDYNEQDLIAAGVLGSEGRRGLTNTSQLMRLHTGPIWQQNTKHMSLVERVDSLSLELESATKHLAVLAASESK